MSMQPKSTCHIPLITSMKKGRQRLRVNHQHTYMMSYCNDVNKNVLVLSSVCTLDVNQYACLLHRSFQKS